MEPLWFFYGIRYTLNNVTEYFSITFTDWISCAILLYFYDENKERCFGNSDACMSDSE